MLPAHRSTEHWRRRVAIFVGAILLGIIALGFAKVADLAQEQFARFFERWFWAPLLVTPFGFVAVTYLTNRFFSAARGSGIPQIIVRAKMPDHRVVRELTSVRTAIAKLVLTILALGFGASVGREGPTVQVGATVMYVMHRIMRVRVTAGIIIAGGAAGVAAAFNAPLAGVAFAIEELASSYEQKVTMQVMIAVMVSGLVSLGIGGDYLYFGSIRQELPFITSVLIAPIAGVFGGITGGAFSLALQRFNKVPWRPLQWLLARPLLWSLLCGIVVAVAGLMSHGLTWGASYQAARHMVEGVDEPLWFGPAKFVTSLVTSFSGIPGGIFAPSLAAGAGFGDLLAQLFPFGQRGGIVLLGMIAYFVGVVRAPLTAVLIISEMTNSRPMIFSLFLAAIVADWVSALICPEKIYHGLAQAFVPKTDPRSPKAAKSEGGENTPAEEPAQDAPSGPV